MTHRIFAALLAAGLFLLSFSPSSAWAWGGRGHHLICLVATRLVQEPGLAKFLESRGDEMGHVCNIPDIYWRSLPATDERLIADSSHYIDPQRAGYTSIAEIPSSVEEFYAHGPKDDKTPVEKAEHLGSVWWRAVQFFDRSIVSGTLASKSTPPSNPAQVHDDSLPYNKGVFDFMVNAGLTGHFVGDVSMPLHNTVNHDGWKSGHGGIHWFYESECVATYPLSFPAEVEKKARTLMRKKGAPERSVLEIMRELSTKAFAEIPKVEAADLLVKPSDGEKRIPAVRKPQGQVCPKFRVLITGEMARSAAALAEIWDMAYRQAQKPDLKPYDSWRYPLTPELVPVNYLSK